MHTTHIRHAFLCADKFFSSHIDDWQ